MHGLRRKNFVPFPYEVNIYTLCECNGVAQLRAYSIELYRDSEMMSDLLYDAVKILKYSDVRG